MYFSKFKYKFDTSKPDFEKLAKSTDEVLSRVINFSPNPNQEIFSYDVSYIDAVSLSRADMSTQFRKDAPDNRGVQWLDTINSIESVKNQLSADSMKAYALKIFKIIFTEQNNSLTGLMNALDRFLSINEDKYSDYQAIFYEDYDGYERGGLSGNNFYIKVGQR